MILFEIEDILDIKNRGVIILVKSLQDSVCFELSDNMKLGNYELKKEFDIPRILDFEGNIRKKLYYLTLRHREDKRKLEIGQIVELTTNANE